MAPPLLWQLLLHTLVLNLLGFPVASSGLTLAGHRRTGLHARYTRSLWSSSYNPPTASWSSTPAYFYGSSPYANVTHLSTALGAQLSSSSLTTGVSYSYGDHANTPRPWTVQTSSFVPTNLSITASSEAPILTPGPSALFTPGSVPAYVSSMTGYPSLFNAPGVTTGPLTPGFPSSSTFDFSTWLSPVIPVPSAFNTTWPVSTQVLTSTTIVNGTSSVVVPYITPQTSAAESVIASTETVSGSTVVTFLPPVTTGDDSHSTGVSSSFSPLQSFIATETTVSGSVVATFVPAPTTLDSLSSSSELRSVERSSSLGPESSTAASASFGAWSTDRAATSGASASLLPTPSAPTPSPKAGISASGSIISSGSSQGATSSTAGMQSGSQFISSLSSSTTVAAFVITPIPIVLSEGEKSSTKDPEKTTGSHSDSVSEDQNGHQLTIHIPVLPGGCWFCPPGPPGFRLPELTLPGVYPPMKPPGPAWMTIPALTIDGNGNPTFEPEPSDDPKASTPASTSATVTSSSRSTSQTDSPSDSASPSFVASFSASVSSCITTTTSVCSTLTSYGVDTLGSTTATSVASQCSPTVGCRVLASKTASATTSSASSSCWEYDFTLDGQKFENEEEQTFQTVDTKAAAHGLDRIGGCSFTRTVMNPTSMVTVPVTINIPTWPAVSDLATVTSAREWYAATMVSEMEGSCPTLTYTTFDSVQSLAASPLMTGVGGIPATYSLDGDKPALNVDHAYDISLIIEFLESIMDSQSDATAYCDSFNDFFIGGAGDPADDNEPRLQSFFDIVASKTPDPVAVDSVLNDVKEKLLANLDGLRGGSDGTKQVGSTNVTMSDSEKLQVLNEIGAALAFINDEGTTSRFNQTNSAIWASWMAVDNLGLNPGCSAAPLPAPTSGSPGWADAYTSYMNSKLDQQNTAISNHIGSIIATQGGWFTQTTDSDGNLNLAGRGLEAFKTGYPESMRAMSTDAMLIWQLQPTYTPLGTATCYSPPTDADIFSFSGAISSELVALSRAATQSYSEASMTPLPSLCSDGSTTKTCWNFGFIPTGTYNSSWSGTPPTFSTWFSSFGNPLTPSPSPTRGSLTAPLTFTRPYPTVLTRSYPASRSAHPTPWATFSAANSSFIDGSSSWSGQSGTTSTLNPAFPTLASTTDTESEDSSSTADGASSSEYSYSTTGDSTSTFALAPWSWFTLPEPTSTTSTTSKNESTYASKTAAPPATATAAARPSCVDAEQGSPATNFDLVSAKQAIDWACSQWVDSKSTRDNFATQWGVPYENPIAFQITYEGDGFDTIDNTYHNTHHCDFADTLSSDDAALQFCNNNLKDILNSCDTSRNSYYWWKAGGSFFRECWAFSMTRGKFGNLPDGLVHNNAEYADSTVPDSINYRPDSTCNVFSDCPLCPVENAQRKCEGSDTDINYCLCLNPVTPPDSIATALPAVSGDNPTKLTCGGGNQGNPKEAFDPGTATNAIDYTCSAWYDAEGDEDARAYYAVHYGSSMENPIYLHISQQDTGGDCPDLYSQDARLTTIATCRDNFEYIVNTCDTSSHDFYWWKLGGTLIKDCYSWQIRREEFDLNLIEPGYHRNNAVDPDDLGSDDYRPDSSCGTRWQDCPNCPGDVWQRKCISDANRVESGACLCFDPTFESYVAGASLDANGSTSVATLNASIFSNTTNVKTMHLPRSRLPGNASTFKTDSEIIAPFVNASTIKTALELNTASGSLQCINAPQGPPRLNFELNGANAAIAYTCRKWADAIPTTLFNVDWSAPYEDPIDLGMLYIGDQRPRSRIRRSESSCGLPYNPTRDDYEALCTVNMQYILNTCNTARNDHYWWKSGGTYTNQCWRWSLTRGSFGRLPGGYLHYDAIGADEFTGIPEYFDYRPDRECSKWQDCAPDSCPLPGSQRKCRGDESDGPSYCVCKA